jgi:NADPH-dependent 2,4-dienoyl-CoA reductase/sulfur reductase-like enzyme
MKKYDSVVIGGGPAGVACAISADNTYLDKKNAVIRKEPIALIPCGIPYTLTSLKSVDEDILPDKLVKNAGSDLIIDEVVRTEGKVLELKSGENIEYDKLVLASGSIPVIPPIKGVDKEGVFFVRKDYNYLSEMRKFAEGIQDIVVVGGGYIGVEMADEALRAGKNVTLIELLPHLLGTSMDEEFGKKAREILEARGAKVLTGRKIESITGGDKVSGVRIDGGDEIQADMVVLSVGNRPDVELAKLLGVDFDEKQGIKVNEYGQTSNHDIFAIGDCAAKYDFFTREPTGIRLASTAMSEGRLVGSNLFKIKVVRKYVGVLGSFSSKIGEVAFGVSGITEAKAKAMNLDYTVGEAETMDRHPGSLPGASKLHLKLIFSRYSHTILGAQMYGGDSVGEMVNMFSVMILNKMTDMDIDTIQIGTHPLLTASPVVYPVITATVDSIRKWY